MKLKYEIEIYEVGTDVYYIYLGNPHYVSISMGVIKAISVDSDMRVAYYIEPADSPSAIMIPSRNCFESIDETLDRARTLLEDARMAQAKVGSEEEDTPTPVEDPVPVIGDYNDDEEKDEGHNERAGEEEEPPAVPDTHDDSEAEEHEEEEREDEEEIREKDPDKEQL